MTGPNPDPDTRATTSPAPLGHHVRPAERVARAVAVGRLATLPEAQGPEPCDLVEEAGPALVLGELSPTDREWVERHLATCGSCSEAISHNRRVDGLLSGISGRLSIARGTMPLLRPVHKRPVVSRGVARRSVLVDRVDSPVGELLVALSSSGVCEVGFAATTGWEPLLARLRASGFDPETVPASETGDLRLAGQQFGEYFAGQRRGFELPLDLDHVTAFTREVLAATREIPYGTVATYRDIAIRIGQPSASRAVGNALGRNPVPLLIPCHRVIRADRTAGGFVGGTAIKQHLLDLEAARGARI